MSESYFVLIPADPSANLPNTAPALRDALVAMLGARRGRVKDYGKLQFIDCGQNFERTVCPACKTVIAIEHWHEWMDEDWHGEEGFHLHRHAMPCCNADRTLNDLEYIWPQGFARWFVSAEINQIATLTDSQIAELVGMAGIDLRTIRQQY